MAVIILSRQDDGKYTGYTTLVEKILEAAPEAVVRRVKGNVDGAEVDDASAVRYLMTRYTPKGNARKTGESDG